jgi:hypothetical protein
VADALKTVIRQKQKNHWLPLSFCFPKIPCGYPAGIYLLDIRRIFYIIKGGQFRGPKGHALTRFSLLLALPSGTFILVMPTPTSFTLDIWDQTLAFMSKSKRVRCQNVYDFFFKWNPKVCLLCWLQKYWGIFVSSEAKGCYMWSLWMLLDSGAYLVVKFLWKIPFF